MPVNGRGNTMKTVLVADDQTVYRKGLVRILAEDFTPTIIDEADCVEEALRKARINDYDLVLLDISMPGREGLEVLKELRDHSPELRVLAFSKHPEEHHAVRALCTGAAGYMAKGSPAEEWVGAIEVVLTGDKYISRLLKDKLAYRLIGDKKSLIATLSPRECQVLRMIAAGKSTRAIAREMSLSVGAVSTYRTRLLNKMRMRSNEELIKYATQHDLLDE
jgi:two-component system, NarL family, invasion response regulator UvrY